MKVNAYICVDKDGTEKITKFNVSENIKGILNGDAKA